MLLFAPFENSRWPPAEVKVCIETLWETTKTSLPSLVLNYIKDCQSILEEVISADRTKNNNKMAKLSN
jgi:hypothetical protein